jgi:subfamily B ATP-binding cassette protein MsbA
MASQTAPASGALDRRLIGRVVRGYLAPHWPSLAVAVVCAGVIAALTGAMAWLLDPAIRQQTVPKDLAAVLAAPLAILAAGLLRGLAQLLQAVLTNRLGNRVVADLQLQLYARLIRLDLAQLRAAHSGTYVSSVLYDAGLVREAATTGLVMYVQNLATVAVMLAVMAVEEIRLTLAVLLAGPIVAATLKWFVARTRSAAQGAMDETSALSTAVLESLDGVRLIKLESREDDEERRVGEVIGRRLGHLIRGANAKALAAPATDSLMSAVLAGVLAYAGWRALGGHVELPNLVSFIIALTLAGQSLRFVANYQPILTEGLAAAARLFAVLDQEPQIGDAPSAVALARATGEIRFEDVRFAYGEDTPALDGVTLEARPGQTIALVGPSGGGKSTILGLIPRFYDVGSGRITLDGRDIREASLKSLRAQLALVTQEPFLFDDTILANIAYGRPGASHEAIVAAAEAAAAHEFIQELPGGYDARVGEAGTRLSGGQRQRIAIARAFLKDAPILLLDEATSALDAESEAKVQQALERLMAGRTTILIAHRLATVRGADVIYVIDKGKVVETGAHEDLTASDGLYARLARSQNLEAEAA